jgi:hypothetical protein
LPSTIKTGQWGIKRGSYGQMRPRLTGLGQMRGSTPEKKGVSPFQTIPLLSQKWQPARTTGLGPHSVCCQCALC